MLGQRGNQRPPAGAESANPPWLGEAPVINDDKIMNTIEADIVIVGGGNTGTMCAFAAAENGVAAEDTLWNIPLLSQVLPWVWQ